MQNYLEYFVSFTPNFLAPYFANGKIVVNSHVLDFS